MLSFIKNNNSFFSLFLIILIGGFLRFYKLDWGNALFTHPDEYHIVSSVSQLSFPDQMHPHFFSYGTVTIYLIYFTQHILQIFNHSSLIINPFLIGRFYSALFSTLTIILVYKICRSFMERRFSYLAAFLTALIPGLIQQAHFATPESALTFFLFACLFFIIKFFRQNKLIFLALSSTSLGLALGVKISSIVFLIPLFISLILNINRKKFLRAIPRFFTLTLTSVFITIVTFAIAAPFAFIDFSAFRGNLEYEGGLAVGNIPVFYTRQFIDTIPILFQLEKILPYALGPFLLFFGILGFLNVMLNLFQHLSFKRILKRVQDDKKIMLIIVIAFLSLFTTNAFLFAKWTRFIAPTFPFLAIFAAYLLNKIYKKTKILSNFLSIILVTLTFLWTTAFFSIYLNQDVRISASNWIEENLPEESTIMIEGGNMVDIPLKGAFNRMGFDFYVLEQDPQTQSKIAEGLEKTDYFLIQSRRVFMNHQRLPDLFPKTAKFYNALFNGNLGFAQIKQFNSYPKLPLINLEFPDETAEETWSVFDHPVIRVFKKTKQFSIESYAKFLEN